MLAHGVNVRIIEGPIRKSGTIGFGDVCCWHRADIDADAEHVRA
jgi:hypothetical protein